MNNEDILDYYKLIEIDKKMQKKFLLINSGYLIHENLNAGKIRFNSVFKKDRYGLSVTVIRLIGSMNITNEKIVESYHLYNMIKDSSKKMIVINSYIYAKYDNVNESIVHDIKRYCDTIITIVFLQTNPSTVEDINIGSIGEYFNNKERIFKDKEEFLILINDLDNSYKHSFSNTMDPLRIGIKDNCIVNLYSKHGKNIFHPIVISVTLRDIVKGFNEFLDLAENILNRDAD